MWFPSGNGSSIDLLDCREEVFGGEFAVDEAGIESSGQSVWRDEGEDWGGGEPFVFHEGLPSFAQLGRVVFGYVVAACRELHLHEVYHPVGTLYHEVDLGTAPFFSLGRDVTPCRGFGGYAGDAKALFDMGQMVETELLE